MDAVAEFIRTNKSGDEIRGDPGIGKSALAGQLVKINDYIHHFNVRAMSCNTPEAFLRNICAQLITAYDLPYQSLPAEAARYAGFLSSLFGEATASRPGQPVVIVVDALDEVDDTATATGRNPLYLPVKLPDGVYVILTAQPAKTPLPPPENRGGGAAATASSTAVNCASMVPGQSSRNSSAGTVPSGAW
jgi:hypothetical protein